ncbi:hypothetical protein [Leptospira terpstrae]|uniref:Lipoprotein n=1 Tax=Leptospira terpstrae serovar Hualin str. LT 11-33 = ATCC 700639 TaxID=1257025 RepID=N1W3F1_9LEPT|nr:hypothetical protein [Leptospira terpstrae]EMY63547.1 putative lipoprotein [Leptospira terpstrae serovar Hualin str. LT 11-33 = ATCC 700639]
MIKILHILLLAFFSSCVSINTKIESEKYKITFSDINEPSIARFQVQFTNHYWFSYNLYRNNEVNESILNELAKYPGSKGIKNLKIRIYNNSWFTFSVLPNPLALFTSSIYMYARPLGFSNKSVHIEGDIF